MSVAFRRDSDEEHLEPRFEIPVPPGPNYVTPAGLAAIEARVTALEEALAGLSDEEAMKGARRDLRYWRQRQSSAQIAPAPAPGTAGIGSVVRFRLEDREREVTITGFDEADPARGRIAFSAPLARALLGAAEGDVVDFAGTEEAIEIIAVG